MWEEKNVKIPAIGARVKVTPPAWRMWPEGRPLTGTAAHIKRIGLDEREFQILVGHDDGTFTSLPSNYVQEISPLEELGLCAKEVDTTED